MTTILCENKRSIFLVGLDSLDSFNEYSDELEKVLGYIHIRKIFFGRNIECLVKERNKREVWEKKREKHFIVYRFNYEKSK